MIGGRTTGTGSPPASGWAIGGNAGVIGEEFGRSPLMVIKDPRICRVIPFYLPVFAHLSIDARFLIVLRNPLAVASSHRRRDGMTLPFAGLLWLAQMLDAERATRRCRRTFVSYEHLLADWRSATRLAVKELTIPERGSPQRQAAVDAFLSNELEHFRFSRAELDANTQISDWVRARMGASCACRNTPSPPTLSPSSTIFAIAFMRAHAASARQS